MGVIVMGKIESGCCRVGDKCLLMPNRTRVEVTNIYYEEIETDSCVCGENVRLKLKNVEEEVSVFIDDIVFIYVFDFVGNFSWIYSL
jgi:translation elongation factor EF-1alpha